MTQEAYITLYGGAPGEIGGNRILLEWPERRWLLDFGTRFGQTGKFFEEFVKPRGATLGLRDYLRMGLLPPLDPLHPLGSAEDAISPAPTRGVQNEIYKSKLTTSSKPTR